MFSYADSPSIFTRLSRIYLQHSGAYPRKFVLQGARAHQGDVLLSLQGLYSRDQAQGWTGALVLVRKKDLPALGPGEIYLFELLTCQVFVEEGDFLGEIRDVSQTGGQEVWTIETPEGAEVLFPAVDQFIVELDVLAGRIVIAPPPGLLDLYLTGSRSPGDEKENGD